MNIKLIRQYIPLVLATALILIILWLLQRITSPSPQDSPPKEPPLESTTLLKRISDGNKILVDEEISPENPAFQAAKERGVTALAANNYEEAVLNFEEAINQYSNAPETKIYLNNARIGTEESRTIAVVGPTISKPTKALEGLRGVAQAQTEINQDGGIDGVPLKVVIANDDDNPEIAQQIASALVENSQISGVVGHYPSKVTLEAGKIYSANKLVVISADSTSVDLSAKPDIFRTVPSDAIAARTLARYMQTNLQQQNAVVFYDPKDTYSKSLTSAFVAAIKSQGGKDEDVGKIDLSKPGFSAFNSVTEAIERNAEVLALAPPVALLDKALQVVVANDGRLNLLGGDVMYDPKTLDFGSDAVGMVLAMPWDTEGDPKSSFPCESSNPPCLWDTAEVNWRTAMAYDAAQALITALKSSPTRAGVYRALKSPDFSAQGVSGIIRFDPNTGDRDESFQLQLIEIRSKSSSRTGYDFVPVPSS